MKTAGIWSIALTLMVLGVAGCRNVQVTFSNTTGQPLELEVVGPGDGVGYLGSIPAYGELRTVVKVSEFNLPTTYSVLAGEYKQAFSITKDSKDKMVVTIPDAAAQRMPNWRLPEGEDKTGEKAPVQFER